MKETKGFYRKVEETSTTLQRHLLEWKVNEGKQNNRKIEKVVGVKSYWTPEALRAQILEPHYTVW